MTKVKQILEQGLEACAKYDENEVVQLEMAKITLKRLENEIVRSGDHSVLDTDSTVSPVIRSENC